MFRLLRAGDCWKEQQADSAYINIPAAAFLGTETWGTFVYDTIDHYLYPQGYDASTYAPVTFPTRATYVKKITIVFYDSCDEADVMVRLLRRDMQTNQVEKVTEVRSGHVFMSNSIQTASKNVPSGNLSLIQNDRYAWVLSLDVEKGLWGPFCQDPKRARFYQVIIEYDEIIF